MNKSKILIIDDNKFFCEMKKQIIEDSGYMCEFSLTADDGLERLKSQPFDLILLDLQIGDVHGIDILPKIKGFSIIPHIISQALWERKTEIQKTKDLRLVQKQLGHVSVKTTEVYVDVPNEDIKLAVNSLY